MTDIVGKKNWFFAWSLLWIMLGIGSVLLWKLNRGIDFTGGTLLELALPSLSLEESSTQAGIIRQIAGEKHIEISSVQRTGDRTVLLRTKPMSAKENKEMQSEITKRIGPVGEIRFETIGPSIGEETTRNALYAVAVASGAIILYVAWAFRTIPKPYSSVAFGICAVIALMHDIIITVGFFAFFGKIWKVEIDSLFLTALLTIMGFSVHDTIVVFDRIRENAKKRGRESFAHIVNESVMQTIGRSLTTSLTVLFTLTALVLFGGESIRWFVIALLIGITSGTYSSIFIASPLLVVWQERKEKTGERAKTLVTETTKKA